MTKGKTMAPRAALRPFLLAAIAYLLIATTIGGALAVLPLLAVPTPLGLRMTHVHLALVGAVSQAMLGSMPFFGVALLATPPPDPRLARMQWWLANFGTLALAAGLTLGWWPGSILGGSLYLIATTIAAWAVGDMMHRSVIARHLDAWYYFVACLFGMAAMLLGLVLASGVHVDWLPRTGVRLAHLHFGLLGWISLTIVGTMRTFFPNVIGGQVRSGASFLTMFWLLLAGTSAVALGMLWLAPLAAIGGLAVALAGLLFIAEMIAVRRAKPGPLPLAGTHLFAASFYFAISGLVGLVFLFFSNEGNSIDTHWLVAYAHVALVGWVLQTLMGALVHLMPVLSGGQAGQSGDLAAQSYASSRSKMEAAAAWQFWLLNLGLLLFAASLAIAPWLQTWPILLLVGTAAMLAALAIFATKVNRVYRSLPSVR